MELEASRSSCARVGIRARPGCAAREKGLDLAYLMDDECPPRLWEM
jgi:hypothetical protein